MPEELQDKPSHLWKGVLDTVAKTVDRHSFNTWLSPIVFAGCDETTWELTVPNEVFQSCILENYSDVLRSAIAEVLGAPRQIRISIRTGPSSSSSNELSLPVVQACLRIGILSGVCLVRP